MSSRQMAIWGLEVRTEKCAAGRSLTVVCIEVVIVAEDTNEVNWPSSSPEEPCYVMARGRG